MCSSSTVRKADMIFMTVKGGKGIFQDDTNLKNATEGDSSGSELKSSKSHRKLFRSRLQNQSGSDFDKAEVVYRCFILDSACNKTTRGYFISFLSHPA